MLSIVAAIIIFGRRFPDAIKTQILKPYCLFSLDSKGR